MAEWPTRSLSKEERLLWYMKQGFRLAPKDLIWFKLWVQRIEQIEGSTEWVLLTSDERHIARQELFRMYGDGIDNVPEKFFEVRVKMLETGMWLDLWDADSSAIIP